MVEKIKFQISSEGEVQSPGAPGLPLSQDIRSLQILSLVHESGELTQNLRRRKGQCFNPIHQVSLRLIRPQQDEGRAR